MTRIVHLHASCASDAAAGHRPAVRWRAVAGTNNTNSDGASPACGVILSGSTLYGTTGWGGSSGFGTIFSISLRAISAPELGMAGSGSNVILTWPTNVGAFTLQSTTNLYSPATWATVSPGPVVMGGQNVVTNAIIGNRKFYRLNQ